MVDIYTSQENRISDSAIIHPSVVIGSNNIIMEGVIIREGVQIGDNNTFGPYCIIGEPAEKVGYFDRPGKVLIGSGCRFTKQVTVDAGADGVTIIKNNVTILKNGHIGHNAEIYDNVVISCNVCIGGFTIVHKDSVFGLGACVHQRLIIPEGIMAGMNCTITKKTALRPFRKYIGSPARDIGANDKK